MNYEQFSNQWVFSKFSKYSWYDEVNDKKLTNLLFSKNKSVTNM